ncbi:MAG: ABC transporter permease [Rhodospirillales bacterium]|nr:ABC transporter permease [Rhodospirillales bacterium]
MVNQASRPVGRRMVRHKGLGRFAGNLAAIGLLVLIVLSWSLATEFGLVAPFLLPAPSAVLERVVTDLTTPDYYSHVGYTLTEILAGFVIAFVAAIPIGALIALVPFVEKAIYPYIVVIQTIPKIAIAPLFIIWIGFGIASKVVIVALICFFPLVMNTIAGFRSIDPRQILLMEALKATKLQTFLKVRIYNALPYIVAGIYISSIFAVLAAIFGEYLGGVQGLGSQISMRQGQMDVAGVFSVIVTLSAIGVTINQTVRFVSRRYVFWGAQHDRTTI